MYILRKGLQHFVFWLAYFVISYVFVIFLCFIALKILGTDVQLSYIGYSFPCHAGYTTPVHYTGFASFFISSGPYLVSTALMLFGFSLLFSKLRRNDYFFHIGLVLVNVPLYYAGMFVFSMSKVFFTNRTLFTNVLYKSSYMTRIVWVVMFIVSIIASLWSIVKFRHRLSFKWYIITLPFALVVFYFGWFYFLGPLIFP